MDNFGLLPDILIDKCSLDMNQRILVGVSGGADSLSLLHYLWRQGYLVVAAHLNHHLRANADSDAEFVENFTSDNGIMYIRGDVDVLAFAKSHSLSVEEAARNLRYQFLFQHARHLQAQSVAIAHTADDQFETILMHLFRGAGLEGLIGMQYRSLPNPWSANTALVRPLLGIYRNEIDEYCSKAALQPINDHTNFDTTIYRNRIRHELLPYLETYNPKIKSAILRMGNILSSDNQALDWFTRFAWQTVCIEYSETRVCLLVNEIIKYPTGIQQRLIRKAINALRPGLRDIDFNSIDRAIQFMQVPSRSRRIDLVDKINLIIEGDFLQMENWNAELLNSDWPQMSTDTKILEIPGEIAISGRWHIRSKPVENSPDVLCGIEVNQDPYCAWVDVGEETHLLIRSSVQGDRFQPLGMEQTTMKLSDFYKNVKIKLRARSAWPVVCVGDAIAWIPGYRLAHPYRVTFTSHRIVYLEMIRI